MWTAVAGVLLRAKVRQACTRSLLRVPKGRSAVPGATLPQHCCQRTARVGHTAQPLNMKAKIQKVEALEENHFVCVHWEDGSESRFPCVWLRDNCQCPDCFLHSAKARKLVFEDLDVNIVVKDVTLTDRKKISITWPDEHTSEYEAEWLKKRCFSEEARAEMRKDLFLPECQYWGSDLQLPELPFEEVLYNDESAYKWLCTLKKVGIVLLTGAPARQGELVKLGQRIGFLRLTFYGQDT